MSKKSQRRLRGHTAVFSVILALGTLCVQRELDQQYHQVIPFIENL